MRYKLWNDVRAGHINIMMKNSVPFRAALKYFAEIDTLAKKFKTEIEKIFKED